MEAIKGKNKYFVFSDESGKLAMIQQMCMFVHGLLSMNPVS